MGAVKRARVVTLIPWRPGDELREQSWEIVRPRLKQLGYPIVTGNPEGVWSRARAINIAAREAGSWDYAIIGDADTIPQPDAIDRAIARAEGINGGVRPHDRLHRLTPSGSIAMAKGRPILDRHIDQQHLGGGYLVVTREAWDRVGGYDERYIWWGYEDTVLNTLLLVKADWDRIEGEAWHLWHPGSRNLRIPEIRDNLRRLRRFQDEHRRAVADAARRKGWPVGSVL